MSPEQAYAQLSRAIDTRPPECTGIDLFTADHITPADEKVLKPICAGCDLALLCRQYAHAAKPDVGYWAGKNHTFKTRRTRQDAA